MAELDEKGDKAKWKAVRLEGSKELIVMGETFSRGVAMRWLKERE